MFNGAGYPAPLNHITMKDYLEDKIKENIIKEISSLDLPKEWTPKQVIDYIIYKIDRN